MGFLGGGEYQAAADASQAGMNAIGGIDIPGINQMKVKLEGLVQQGLLSPEMADQFLQQATEFNNMDPMSRNELVETIESKGFDPQARAALHALQGETGAQERGGREAIMQDAAARGISGSGIEAASQMANQQGSATRMANQGFQAAADANQRQMQAVGQLSAMDAQKAAAQDSINQFNKTNQMNWAQNAEQKNLAEKQRIADTNVGTRNQQEVFNKGLYQQDFQNNLETAKSYSNAAAGQAQTQGENAKTQTAMANKWSDENLKTDIKEVDPQEMLDNLQGYSYQYKDGMGMEDGEQVGVMAQDLEEAAPQAVEDTPGGKTIDYAKMGGPMLAALASLNERLNNLEANKDGR